MIPTHPIAPPDGTPTAAERDLADPVAPVLLRAVLREARRLGLEPDTLCRGLGFAAAALDTPGLLVSSAEAAAVLRRALPLIGNPNLGFELGLQGNILGRGPLALGLLASATLGEALRLMLEQPSAAGLLVSLHEERGGGQHGLLAASPPGQHDLEPFVVDELFTGLVRFARQAVGEGYAPVLVEFVRERPADAAALQRYFRCPVRFSSARNRLVSEDRWLEVELPTADAMTLRWARALLQGGSGGARSVVELAVARAIRVALPAAPATPATVASSLNLSERTLRRRLMASGLSYRAMQDDGRKSRALALVLNGRMALAEVATEVGFSGVGSLRRAFKRWTGRTVAQMRGENNSSR